MGSALADLRSMPDEVQDSLGAAIGKVQWGKTPDHAKPWKGEGPGVFQLVEQFDGDAYRAIYLVRYEEAVYVLHCFQKKSTQGIKTSKHDVDLVSARMKAAHAHHSQRYGDRRNESRRDRG
jgi:phage-related protein